MKQWHPNSTVDSAFIFNYGFFLLCNVSNNKTIDVFSTKARPWNFNVGNILYMSTRSVNILYQAWILAPVIGHCPLKIFVCPALTLHKRTKCPAKIRYIFVKQLVFPEKKSEFQIIDLLSRKHRLYARATRCWLCNWSIIHIQLIIPT